MLPIVQILESRANNLRLLNTANVFTTKHADDAGRSNGDQNGGFNYGQILETVGSTVINGYYNVLGDPDVFRTVQSPAPQEICTYNNRTAQCRLAVPIACKTGKTITSFLFENINHTLEGSGITGTLTLTLKKMATDGALTTIATYTGTMSATITFSPGAVGTPTVMNAGDRLIMEISIAPASGTHNTTNYCRMRFLITIGHSILNIF